MADPEDNSIKVSVRIRPLNSRELTTSNKEGFEYNNECMLEKVSEQEPGGEGGGGRSEYTWFRTNARLGGGDLLGHYAHRDGHPTALHHAAPSPRPTAKQCWQGWAAVIAEHLTSSTLTGMRLAVGRLIMLVLLLLPKPPVCGLCSHIVMHTLFCTSAWPPFTLCMLPS